MFDKEAWRKKLKAILSLDSHPGHIAAGLAVGVFISITPFFGLHTPMALVAAFIFRLNKVTCVTGAWVNTPITVVPVLGLSFKLGQVLLGNPPAELTVQGLKWQYLKPHATSLLLGSSVIGFVAAVVTYFASYYLIVRFRKKDDTLRTLTKEMVEVGEDLQD